MPQIRRYKHCQGRLAVNVCPQPWLAHVTGIFVAHAWQMSDGGDVVVQELRKRFASLGTYLVSHRKHFMTRQSRKVTGYTLLYPASFSAQKEGTNSVMVGSWLKVHRSTTRLCMCG
jgi:hypothetical protein